MKSDR